MDINCNYRQGYNVHFGTITPRTFKNIGGTKPRVQYMFNKCRDILEKSEIVEVDMEKGALAPSLKLLKPFRVEVNGKYREIPTGTIISLNIPTRSISNKCQIQCEALEIIQDGKEAYKNIVLRFGRGTSKACENIVDDIFATRLCELWTDKVPVLGALVDAAYRRTLKDGSHKNVISQLQNMCDTVV